MIGVLADWSPSQDSNHPDDLFQSRYVTPGFKPFSYIYIYIYIYIYCIFFTCHVLGYRGFQLTMANYSKCMKEVQSGEIDVGSSQRGFELSAVH